MRLEGNASLKGKRKVVKSILGRVKARFNVAASEVGQQILMNWLSWDFPFAVRSDASSTLCSTMCPISSKTMQMPKWLIPRWNLTFSLADAEDCYGGQAAYIRSSEIRGEIITEDDYMAQRRLDKINELLRQAVAELLLTKSKDPRLKTVNVTGVEVTAELNKAGGHYSTMAAEEERANIQKALVKASGFIRSSVGEELRLKYSPEIKFEFDRNLEYAHHMNDLLNRLSTKHDVDKESNEDG